MNLETYPENVELLRATLYNMRWAGIGGDTARSLITQLDDSLVQNTEIYYQAETSWERDFILRELLPPAPCTFFKAKELLTLKPDSARKHVVFVFSSNWLKFSHVKNFCARHKPAIVFHCSDEYGNRPEYEQLTGFCRLYMRQYSHAAYSKNKQVCVIPLGYVSGMFPYSSFMHKLKSMAERTLPWAHVGVVKSDREEMRQAFNALPGGYCGLADKVIMRELYSNAKFVPVGRGNASVNCFRIYEAIVCGAIPVVVAPVNELARTFVAEEAYPWLTAQTWKDAAELCQGLLTNPTALDDLQQKCVTWWRQRITGLNKLVTSVLQK